MKQPYLMPFFLLIFGLSLASCCKDGERRYLTLPFKFTKTFTIESTNQTGKLNLDTIREASQLSALLALNNRTTQQLHALRVTNMSLTAKNNANFDAFNELNLDLSTRRLPRIEMATTKPNTIASNTTKLDLNTTSSDLSAYFKSDTFFVIPVINIKQAIPTAIEIEYKFTLEAQVTF